jgi:hypothetical protein
VSARLESRRSRQVGCAEAGWSLGFAFSTPSIATLMSGGISPEVTSFHDIA